MSKGRTKEKRNQNRIDHCDREKERKDTMPNSNQNHGIPEANQKKTKTKSRCKLRGGEELEK
ncbi:hypothetical protein KC19_3G252600 [Ceratodon purpureus]|uniref:Uncharacterized protein n=1 Tax=Ceratodon purpureus TaxID=3225 RepID=A0A8T0IQC6_CERPU|nr:hypothetical protein KC19_3G252600 [Ceratodon purpureus]